MQAGRSTDSGIGRSRERSTVRRLLRDDGIPAVHCFQRQRRRDDAGHPQGPFAAVERNQLVLLRTLSGHLRPRRRPERARESMSPTPSTGRQLHRSRDGNEIERGFVLVRHQAKVESPLREISNNQSLTLSVIAQIDFYGRTARDALEVTGYLNITFADFGNDVGRGRHDSKSDLPCFGGENVEIEPMALRPHSLGPLRHLPSR